MAMIFSFGLAAILLVHVGLGRIDNAHQTFFGRWTPALKEFGTASLAFIRNVFAEAFPPRDLVAPVAKNERNTIGLSRLRHFVSRLVAREPSKPTVSSVRAFA